MRLPVGVMMVLRETVPNISGFVRGLVVDGLQRLPIVFEVEEYQLEVQVTQLTGELERCITGRNCC